VAAITGESCSPLGGSNTGDNTASAVATDVAAGLAGGYFAEGLAVTGCVVDKAVGVLATGYQCCAGRSGFAVAVRAGGGTGSAYVFLVAVGVRGSYAAVGVVRLTGNTGKGYAAYTEGLGSVAPFAVKYLGCVVPARVGWLDGGNHVGLTLFTRAVAVGSTGGKRTNRVTALRGPGTGVVSQAVGVVR